MSIYEDMKEAGVEMDNHYSDLYVEANAKALKILDKPEHEVHKKNARYFESGVVNLGNGLQGRKLWIDIPFAFDPWWKEKGLA
jgi:hypothetical protein